ncbi:hypothetical protein AB0H43_32125 [Hamadaea sp. NPDC050747]|uniref:hypothetical protein n=1 Tax=Hamadaea sp. NPDC050747 TaxID=3155789 RepID=UPI0033D5050A
MTTVDMSDRSKRWITYVLLGAIFLILAIVALGVFRTAKASASANAKADQLISDITAAGYTAPSKDQIVTVLGEDGGAVCADPASALRKATLNAMMTNGAGGPGARPVISDSLAVRGQLAIMKVYCPDKLPDFQQYADSLKFDDVVKR